MQYEDEIIAALKKEQRNQKYADIKGDGVYINDRFIKFLPRQIYDRVNIYMPEEFIDMPEEIRVMVYPSVNRPQIILTSLDCSVHFTFNLVEDKIMEEQLPDLMVQLEEIIHKSNPAIEVYQETEGILPNGHPIYMFDYKSYGVDEQIYNMVCFTTLGCGTLHGTFSCLDGDSESWKDAAWQAFRTISEHSID